MRAAPLIPVLVLAASTVAIDGSAHDVPTGATPLDAGGCLRRASGAPCIGVAIGVAIPPHASYVAGPSGGRVRLSDGSVLSLEPKAEIEVLAPTRLVLGSDVGVRGQSIHLTRGLCDVEVAQANPGVSAVFVRGARSPGGVVKRGLSTLRASGDRFFAANTEGELVAGSGNDWRDVPPGKMRVFVGDDSNGAVRSLPQPPAPHASSRVLLDAGGAENKPIDVRWSPVPGASEYEVVVRRADQSEALRRRVPATETSTQLTGDLSPGSFSASVRTLDGDAMPSRWAPPIAFTVIGVTLPDGARISENGVIQIARDQKVGLAGLDGLEMAYGDAWVSPPTTRIGLWKGEPQTVRFRRRGDAQTHSIRIEPRSVVAIVELSPKNPRWPGDAVTIVVRLADRNGGAPPSDVEMHPHVLVDLSPEDVTWTMVGRELHAAIPPRDFGKPHVIRVEVTDQYGLEIGRGFVEVAPAAAGRASPRAP